MNQRKPAPCLTCYPSSFTTPCALPRSSASMCFGWPRSSPLRVCPQSFVSSAAAAIASNLRTGGGDITRSHAIMCTMNTDGLPSPPSRLMLSGMLTVPPFAPLRCFSHLGRRSLGSLAAVAGRVANGLRVSPAGSCSPARCLAPSCPPLRALAWGLFAALPFAPLAAQKSTVVSLL